MAEEKNKDLYKEAQELIAKEGIEEVIEAEPSTEKEAPQESVDHRKIKAQIENTLLDDDVKMQAQASAGDLQSLETKGKIEKLMQIAKEKGVVYAVAVAKKMNDPFILDTLHDMLAQEGYYRNFKF